MSAGLSFVIPGQLAGLARPGGAGRHLRAELERLREEGIAALVSLTEEPLSARALEAAGLEALHLPIADFSIPTPEQIDRFVAFAKERIDRSRGVAVHCGAGLGRTGTMLACYLVALGESAAEAIGSVRAIRPGSIETGEQERCVRDYERRRRGGGGESSG